MLLFSGSAHGPLSKGIADRLGTRLAACLREVPRWRVARRDLLSRTAEGLLSMPAEHLSAVSVLADALRPAAKEPAVIVAPDLGAVRLAERYGRILQLPVATIHKTRMSGLDVKVQQLVGDVRGRAPIIVDDMLSTGGTVAAAVRAVLAAGAAPDISVVVTHGVCAPQAQDLLVALPIARILTTDSVPPRTELRLLQIVTLPPLLAEAIRRLDRDESLGDLVSHG